MTEPATTTLSSKHRITLPVALVRELGLAPGDKLIVRLEDGLIVLKPRPRSWVDYISGSMPGYYGKTKEDVRSLSRRGTRGLG
jgi:AbrB family looped-hinge helix DNA binding protein